MSAPYPTRPFWPWRPTVVGSMVYAALFALFVLWIMSSLEGREFADFVLRERVSRLTLFHLLSIANGLGLVILVLDVGAARRCRSAQRQPQYWGLLLSIAMMAGLQAATFSMLNAAQALTPG